MKDILLATKNRHKYSEILPILSDCDCCFLFAGDFPDYPEVEENGNTLFDNALLKAKQTAIISNKVCIAEDSGLFVKSLGGQPGVYSARYAGEPCDFQNNITKLLTELANKDNRDAYFCTVCVLYDPVKGLIGKSEGIVNGTIITELRGNNGFGYDPVFVPIGYSQTYAELDEERKRTMSHRFIAITNLKPIINNFTQGG
ncbi:MAG: RdgB/HAM1 family non-canonical purine NTP pyrophosphatase [Candidatus Cloacimonetes bacterium]|nr:RdgB/HAM1 family non-canonical purine NTP pyrophosphatase [Candidatus Cloacimonadota bacterium]